MITECRGIERLFMLPHGAEELMRPLIDALKLLRHTNPSAM
jgi:hypothetical protein